MKLTVLKGIAHNLADSVASGLGFMIGVYSMDIFREAAASPEGFIEVDFLGGHIGRNTVAQLGAGYRALFQRGTASLVR